MSKYEHLSTFWAKFGQNLEANKLVFSIFNIIEKICQKLWAKPPSTNEKKKPLQVDVRRSKTSLLKFTIIREGTPHMKGVGMLAASLRGINFGFWFHLGCSGQNAIIFSREGLF